MSNSPVISYRSTPPRIRRNFLFYYLLYLLLVGAPVIFFSIFVFTVVPMFQEIFMDFRTTLPLATMCLFDVAYWMTNPIGWAAAIAFCAAFPLLSAWINTRPPRAKTRFLIALLFAVTLHLLTLAALLFIQIALCLPFAKIVQSVSGGT